MGSGLNERFVDLPGALPVRWDERLAHLVSDILCPPVTVSIGLLVIVRSTHEPRAWIWAWIIIALTIGIPASYIFWKVYSGEISDFHIPVRTQRFRPMVLSILCALLTLAILWVGNAPPLLMSFMGFGIILAAVMLLITLQWKISGHSTAIAGMIILLIYSMGQAVWLALLLIPLVAWARIRLKRHTLAQTIAGAVLGIIFITLFLIFFT
jgi:membrane-associated phospholipid phosphatase